MSTIDVGSGKQCIFLSITASIFFVVHFSVRTFGRVDIALVMHNNDGLTTVDCERVSADESFGRLQREASCKSTFRLPYSQTKHQRNNPVAKHKPHENVALCHVRSDSEMRHTYQLRIGMCSDTANLVPGSRCWFRGKLEVIPASSSHRQWQRSGTND